MKHPSFSLVSLPALPLVQLLKEHVDPSLFVVEPAADVPGLDVWDTHLGEWVGVEAACAPSEASASASTSWVVFGGRCLENATGGRVRACLHRVTRSATDKRRRFCFIFEQKLGDYYDNY
jgi:isopenicillin N synthase-like dioxygenase